MPKTHSRAPGGLHSFRAVPIACALVCAVALPAGAQLRFSDPLYQVGQFDAPDEQVFGDYVTPALAAAGDMFLGDWSTGQIRHFDARGRFVGAFGRKGGGPGEFAALTSIAVNPRGDSIYVFDAVRNGVSVFTAAGRLARTFPLPLRPVGTLRMALHPAGYLLFTGQTTGSPSLLHLTTLAGRPVRSFAPMLTATDLSGVRYQRDAVRRQLMQGFAAALPDGDVLVLLEAPYRVARYSLNGNPRWSVSDPAVGSPLGSMLITRDRYRMGVYSSATSLYVLGPDQFVVLYADYRHERRNYDVRSSRDGRLLARRELPFRSHISALLPRRTGEGIALITDVDPYNRFYLSRWELH